MAVAGDGVNDPLTTSTVGSGTVPYVKLKAKVMVK